MPVEMTLNLETRQASIFKTGGVVERELVYFVRDCRIDNGNFLSQIKSPDIHGSSKIAIQYVCGKKFDPSHSVSFKFNARN